MLKFEQIFIGWEQIFICWIITKRYTHMWKCYIMNHPKLEHSTTITYLVLALNKRKYFLCTRAGPVLCMQVTGWQLWWLFGDVFFSKSTGSLYTKYIYSNTSFQGKLLHAVFVMREPVVVKKRIPKMLKIKNFFIQPTVLTCIGLYLLTGHCRICWWCLDAKLVNF